MGDVMPAGPTLMPTLCAHLQGGLLGLGRVLRLAVLASPVLLTPCMLAVLGLLLLERWGVWL